MPSAKKTEPYKLLIEAETKSKAKILRIPVPSQTYIEGEKFGVSFILTNLGKDPFPDGHITVKVEWGAVQQRLIFDYEIPEILPKKSFQIEEKEEESGYYVKRLWSILMRKNHQL